MGKTLLLSLLILLGISSAQDKQTEFPHDEYLCQTTLPLSSPTGAVSIRGGAVLKVGRTTSFSWMALRNETDSAITEYVLLLEVFDDSRRRINGFVFHGVYGDTQERDDISTKSGSPYSMGSISPLGSPIQAGRGINLVGMSAIVSSRCPAMATLSFIFLKFADGTTKRYSSPGWRTDPFLSVATDHLLLGDCFIPKGKGTSAVIELNAQGVLKSLALRGPGIPNGLGVCLRRELSLWKFEPALVEGRPVASQIRLVVLFDPTEDRWARWQNEYSKEVARGTSLLDLRPWPSGDKDWNFSYSSNCCLIATKFHP